MELPGDYFCRFLKGYAVTVMCVAECHIQTYGCKLQIVFKNRGNRISNFITVMPREGTFQSCIKEKK